MKDIVDLYGEVLADVILTTGILGLLFWAIYQSGWVQDFILRTLLTAC